MYQSNYKRSPLESQYGPTKAQQELAALNRQKAVKVLQEMVEAGEEWTQKQCCEKAGLNHSYFQNLDSRRLYNQAVRKVREKKSIVATFNHQEFSDVGVEKYSDIPGPSVQEKRARNLARLDEVLEELIKNKITDASEWSNYKICRRMATVGDNWVGSTNIEAKRRIRRAKERMEKEMGITLDPEKQRYQENLKRLEALLKEMTANPEYEDPKYWSFTSIAKAMGLATSTLFALQHEEARQMVLGARREVFGSEDL